MPKVLQVRDLAIGYDDEVLLDEIAFDVQRGEVFAILGGSGSGKSTLLRTLIGLQEPLQGRVHFTGIGPPARAMTPPSNACDPTYARPVTSTTMSPRFAGATSDRSATVPMVSPS